MFVKSAEIFNFYTCVETVKCYKLKLYSTRDGLMVGSDAIRVHKR